MPQKNGSASPFFGHNLGMLPGPCLVDISPVVMQLDCREPLVKRTHFCKTRFNDNCSCPVTESPKFTAHGAPPEATETLGKKAAKPISWFLQDRLARAVDEAPTCVCLDLRQTVEKASHVVELSLDYDPPVFINETVLSRRCPKRIEFALPGVSKAKSKPQENNCGLHSPSLSQPSGIPVS